MKKIILVAGARPNFMKIAPILRVLRKGQKFEGIVVHTGQHYDQSMAGAFFESLGIGAPDFNLEVGSASHAVQTARIMIAFEEVCLKVLPDAVLVVGDVNSTIAAGLVAKKLNIPLWHVEAGLRSGDRRMPEEINRIATDAIADLFFTSEQAGSANLLAEGRDPLKVHFVGNVMIDTLFYQLSKADRTVPSVWRESIADRLPPKYACMTLHRPSNVDNRELLAGMLQAAVRLSAKAPIIFPCHPRTAKNIREFALTSLFADWPAGGATVNSGLFMTGPLGYDDFLYLLTNASLVITDSGGLQEETTALKIPCITARDSTERPVTVEVGSNIIAGPDPQKIFELGERALEGQWKECSVPEKWDGKASERIVEIVNATL
ncbi:MAG: UDP-N-acetylglucosamine 2-epimerase (non-hydrolyzing) [Chitinivibrionales bacterium]|nr:UDP-N-acetylglucosamine 2-epimerase (non-hydrolyzing) [Chitinivibrionales bacterium]